MKKYFLLVCFLLCLVMETVNAQYRILLNFNDTNGAAPYGSLTLSGSKLYGMASGAWLNGWGLIFSIDTDGSHYIDLHDFDLTNGAEPFGSLTLSGNKLYGMTYSGGAHSAGVIFSMDTNGSHYKKLLTFNDTNGAEPYGTLTLSGNKLYGMTSIGGAYNDGLIFSIDTNGSHYKDLLDFNHINGILPNGSLTISGSKLYGMASGGRDSDGIIFSIDTNGSHYKDLLDFNGANGSAPQGSLTLSGNKLYGMTYKGGPKNAGLVFSIDTNGSRYKDLLDLNIANGYFPYGDLTLSGSTLHGMIFGGGANNKGLIFSMDTNGGHYKDLLDFNGTNGAYPTGNLTLSGNTSYGMTSAGGPDDAGLIFSLSVPFSVSISNTFPRCQGNSGEAIAYASEGKTPYSYKWMPGGSTKDTLTGLSAGAYTVMVTDSSHSTVTSSVVITEPTALTSTMGIPNNVLCNGGTGSATVKVNGGTSPYSYAWFPSGGTNAKGTGLTEGAYTVTVLDNNNCSATSSVTITQPTAMVITKDSINITNASVCNGAASLTVNGGAIPYRYRWSPGGGSNDTISGRCANYYCCTITDHNGCQEKVCVTISDVTGTSTIIATTEQVNIYPNPSDGVFTLQANSYQPLANSYVEIYNMLGEKVYSHYQITKSSNYQIDLSNRPIGIYLYRVITETGNLIGQGKIVIAK